MIKAILFDGDGVVIKPHKYFSQRLKEEGYNVPDDKIKQFFQNEYKLVAIGKADLKEEVQKYVESWNWDKSVDDLLEYWFSGENDFNFEILNLVSQLKAKGYKCYLASDHSKYRGDDLMAKPELKDKFEEAFFSAYIGYTKEEPEFFQYVLNKLELKSEEVLFIDDDPKNIEIAKDLGIKAVVYESEDRIQKILNEITD